MRTLAVIFLTLFSFSSTFAQSPEYLDELLKKGIALHDKSDYAGAIKLYDEILKKDPANHNALYEKSFSLFAMGKYQDCADLCKEMLKQFPDKELNKGVYINYGSAEDHLGKPQEAIAIYSEGISKYPDHYLLYFNRAVTEYLQKETEKATADLKRSVSLNPLHPSSHMYLGYCMASTNKLAAMMSFSTFLMIEPTGQRAERALAVLGKLSGANVEKTGKNNITISLPSAMVDTTLKMEDDFRSADMAISMLTALDMGKKKKENGAEKLKEKLSMFVSIITENDKEKKRTGFFTTFYLPFFKKLKEENKLETASYIISTSSEEKDIKKWLSKNSGNVNEFYDWLKSYEWSKEAK